MKNSFYTYSFGCRVNQAEIEEISSQLISKGFMQDKDNPSFYIINTCAVTQKAEREVKKFLRSIRINYPNTRIVVTGCAGTAWKKNNKVMKEVDLLLDNQNKKSLAGIVSKNDTSEVSLRKSELSKYSKSRRVILKIQDGCNRFCTYCIVPYLRGRPTSINSITIVTKIKNIEKDINEVILTAINTEAYGLDTGEKFTDLINNILEKTRIKRLSFGSINPWSINDEFINLYKRFSKSPRFVDYFHIPIQSGSDNILKLMKRDYTRNDIEDKFDHLYKINPDIFFGTDIICGFLGETDNDFQETYNFLEKSPIAKFHIFRFSIRNHTAASFLSDKIKEPDEKTKIIRSQALIKLGHKKYAEFQNKLIGKSYEAMFIKKNKDGFQEALLENQMPILIKTPKGPPFVASAKKGLLYEIKNVKILELTKGKLIGKVL